MATPSTTIRANVNDLKFLDPRELILKEAQRLRQEEKVDAVVLTYHDGGGCRTNTPELQDDLTSCEDSSLFKMLKSLPEGTLDVVVAGHTHKEIAKRMGSTVVLQSASHGRIVGWAQVDVKDKTQKPLLKGFQDVIVPADFLGEPVKADETVVNMIKPDVDRVHDLKEASLGAQALKPFKRSYDSESELGNLIADEMLMAMGNQAQVAVTNGGGLRANIDAGPLTYGAVFDVMPFDNRLTLITLDGETLKKMVAIGIEGGHSGLSWAGLTFTAKGCDVEMVTVQGHALEPQSTYVVVTSDFLATGGDGFKALGLKEDQIRILWDGPYIQRDVIAQEIKAAHKDLDPADFYDSKNLREKITGRCVKSAGTAVHSPAAH